MLERNPADRYHRAIKRLTAAEARHRESLDALDEALQAREPNRVPGLRKSCGESERKLAEDLQAAYGAWRDYWQGWRIQMVPDLQRAAHILDRYDRICRVLGDASRTPALTFLQGVQLERDELVSDAAVPMEPPDSDLLESHRGSWRHP